MKHLTAILLLLIGTTSCTHKSNSYLIADGYLIVGHAGGFVGPGATTDYYLISGGKLKEDTSVLNSIPPSGINAFNFNITLPATKYAAVSSLPSSIPAELFSRNNQHIGGIYPDMGYTDVRTAVNGTAYRWYFEGDQSTSNPAIQQFVTSLDTLFK